MKLGVSLRVVAIAIAIAGIIDPSIAWTRHDQPVVSVVAASSRDVPLADQAARELGKHFTVVRTPDAGAAALVVAGDRVPDEIEPGGTPAFALLPADAVRIDRLDVPERASVDSRVPVDVFAHVRPGTTTVDARLRVNGLVVDRATLTPRNADVAATLTFAAPSTGLTRVQVEVTAGTATASADAAIEVDRTRWSVLSFDPRPSWAATFVRRALEEDPRFAVTARIATSPAASTETGAAPAALGSSLDSFDLIVVGAPDALSAGDVDRLEAFLRRGGSVCLLMDRQATGAYERLTGASAWTGRQSAQPTTLESGADRLGRLQVSEFVWPTLSLSAETVASTGGRPVIWRTHIGSGVIVVSGALDAWRQRGADGSDFARFWQTVAADASEAARGLMRITLGQRVFAPGAPMTIRVAFGDPSAATRTTTTVRARIEGGTTTEALRLWPERPGLFEGTRPAPITPGVYRVAVDGAIAPDARDSTPNRGSETFLVADNLARVSDRGQLTAWSAAHGGRAVENADVAVLDETIGRAVQPPARAASVFPMRSPWWILPFALTLTAEWWLRRRRGQP